MKIKKQYKVAITTPYPAPNLTTFYQNVASHPRIDLTVYYYSEAVLERYSEYGIKNEDWDIDLVGKFNYKFLKNYSLKAWKSSRISPFRFINPQICEELNRNRFDAIVLGNWDNVTSWLAIPAAKFFGTPVLLLSDSNHISESEKPAYKIVLKKILLEKCLFPIVSACLYPGFATRRFYELYGVSEKKLFRFSYSIDTAQFITLYDDLKDKRAALRADMGIPDDAFVILFVGRFHVDDLPLNLLKAYQKVTFNKKALIFVGDGPLKKDLQDYTYQHDLEHVYFPGFQSRMKLPRFYASADLFVHPASFEPWGMTIHEAMCFGLPVIATDRVGSAEDLVRHNENGFIYQCKDIGRLAFHIDELAADREKRKRFSDESLEIVKMNWGPEKAGNDLVEALDFVFQGIS